MLLENNTIPEIVTLVLFSMGMLSLVVAFILTIKIRRSDKEAVDQFIISRLGWRYEQEARYSRLVQLKRILQLFTIGSVVVATFALLNALLYRGQSDNSISITFLWSSGLLLFASVYCSALWLLVNSVLKKWTDII